MIHDLGGGEDARELVRVAKSGEVRERVDVDEEKGDRHPAPLERASE